MYLPEDVLIQILSRLPVKSLMRFRAACKSWNSLVKSPAFVSKHLENHTNSSTVKNISRLLVCHRGNPTNKRLISLFSNDNLKEFISQDLSPFFDNKFGHIRLIGPCNGIVCLYGFTDNIALWNPSIREFKTLPVSPIPRPPDARILCGDLAFGFDSKTNDYKVMQILFCSSNKFGVAYHVEIYNLTTDSWREYGGIVPANIIINAAQGFLKLETKQGYSNIQSEAELARVMEGVKMRSLGMKLMVVVMTTTAIVALMAIGVESGVPSCCFHDPECCQRNLARAQKP
ncbi:hypothetical protein RHMOL_Rhmol03G0293100 [Rhododendron molle]|uniref:Uncharacterized protein n=1 Tax=Rhododendron molle TaxID=49168 RepID=A0ACC0PL94_RHOML|nr:hypothetical protein RHMOL_Rhmol03G0293100 [Rhododendron molle]